MINPNIDDYLSNAFTPTSDRVRNLILAECLHIDDIEDFRSKHPEYYEQIGAACKNYLWGNSTRIDDAYIPAETAYRAVWSKSVSKILTQQDMRVILYYLSRKHKDTGVNDCFWELREDAAKPLSIVREFLRERKYENWTTNQIADITRRKDYEAKEAIAELKADKQVYAYKVKHDNTESQVNQWCPHHYMLGYGAENKVGVMADVVLMIVTEFPGITYKRLEGNQKHTGMVRAYLRKFDKSVLGKAVRELEEIGTLVHVAGRAKCRKYYLKSRLVACIQASEPGLEV